MRSPWVGLAAGCLCLAAGAQQPVPPHDAWGRVLAAAGLTRTTARFDLLDMGIYGGDEHKLRYFHALHADPLRIPSHARVFRTDALVQAQQPGGLAMQAAGRIDAGTRLTLLGDPLAEEARSAAQPGALQAAVAGLHAAAGKPLTGAERSRLDRAVRSVPAVVARQAAFVLLAQARAIGWRNRALKAVPEADRHALFAALAKPAAEADGVDALVEAAGKRADLPHLMVGGELAAMAAHRAGIELGKAPHTAAFSAAWETPVGRIVLNGAGPAVVPEGAYLLVMDTAGDDTYHGGGATAGPANPVSVLIDVAGRDRYLAQPGLAGSPVAGFAGRKRGSKTPCFGAGVLGYGVVVDMAGSDLYRSLSTSQGSGVVGLGALIDAGGDDEYDAYTGAQGAGLWGVGILADLAGRDRYRCFASSQGFGGTRGCGLLVDAGDGDDTYDANDAVIDFPSPQSAEHNASLAQGAGFGRRADYSDGHSMAGGVGALVDEAGNNRFTCGVFGQGTGYWFGLGLLLTGKGDDHYAGAWYTGGAAAHFAVGVLADAGGSDTYRGSINMALGAGHDFSTGFLVDYAGSDRYEAPNLSLGGGNANGFGFFWDVNGDDTYIAGRTVTLGRAGGGGTADTLRGRNLTLGIFLDTGGRDTYPADQPWASDGAAWTMDQSGPAPHTGTRGAGLDVEAPGAADPDP